MWKNLVRVWLHYGRTEEGQWGYDVVDATPTHPIRYQARVMREDGKEPYVAHEIRWTTMLPESSITKEVRQKVKEQVIAQTDLAEVEKGRIET